MKIPSRGTRGEGTETREVSQTQYINKEHKNSGYFQRDHHGARLA